MMLTASARAQLVFETNSGALTVVAWAGDVSALSVPAETNGLPVTGIGAQALCGGTVRSLSLPASIINIAPDAFACLCPTLTNIVVDEANPVYCSVGGVLLNKAQTALLQFPSGRAGSYTISNGVASIGDNAFYYAFGLTNITLCAGITSIGTGAFANCGGLGRIELPGSVVTVGSSAFSGCVAATNVILGTNLSILGDAAFSGCFQLGKIVLPDSVVRVGNSNFANCWDLTNVVLGANVASIGNGAFSGCSKLRGVYFRGDMPAVASRAFSDTPATVFYLPQAAGWGDSCGGVSTELWNPQAQADGSGSGAQGGEFGFTIAGTAGIPFVVEACTNMSRPTWVALQACTLTNGAIRFRDPDSKKYPARFYRMRSP